jgi:iron complex transport system permease protein
MRRSLTTPLLVAAALLAAWASVGVTSSEGELVFDALWPRRLAHLEATLADQVLLYLRLPRVLAGLTVGACLALAGLVLQGVTRNPLADPYLLGVSGGAGTAVVLLHALPPLLEGAGFWLTPAVAFGGAQAATLLVLITARGSGGRLTVVSLILAGIVINALCAASIAFLLARLDPFRLTITTRWLAGGIGFVSWPQLLLTSFLLGAAGLYLRLQAARLNAFALGQDGAEGLGVSTDRLLRRSALVSSLLSGLAVSLSGLLGYVGLIVPHLIRFLTGRDLRVGIWGAMAGGALLLVLADGVARIVFSPEELPVGILTALLGCPMLLVLLRAQLRKRP